MWGRCSCTPFLISPLLNNQIRMLLILPVSTYKIHRSATTLKPLMGEVDSIDDLVMMQCSSGKPLVNLTHITHQNTVARLSALCNGSGPLAGQRTVPYTELKAATWPLISPDPNLIKHMQRAGRGQTHRRPPHNPQDSRTPQDTHLSRHGHSRPGALVYPIYAQSDWDKGDLEALLLRSAVAIGGCAWPATVFGWEFHVGACT